MPVRGRHILMGAVLWSAVGGAAGQGPVADRIVPDTAVVRQQYERSSTFYERLEDRSDSSRLARKLYRMLVSEDARLADTLRPGPSLDKEVSYYQPWEGRRIGSITVMRRNIYNERYARGNYRALANTLHAVTSEREIRRNLLFREGEALSPALMAQNEQLLRALIYLADVDFHIFSRSDGSVDVWVMTRDAWSIGVGMRSTGVHSSPYHRRYIDLYDNNILGTGNRLDVGTYIGLKGKKYGGNKLEYHALNLWGSFFSLDVRVGKGYEEHDYGVEIGRQFIRTSDYLLGAKAEDRTWYEHERLHDSVYLLRHRDLEAWAGRSWDFPLVKGSFYVAGRAMDRKFPERPAVQPDSNTFYHSRRALLLGTGIYRETYYRGNMIYGYGLPENIPYGHKVELTAGYDNGEFTDRWYTALGAAFGRQTSAGYIRAAATWSSYWNLSGRPAQGALQLELDAFSNLWTARRNHLRQFVSVRYLSGTRRGEGEGERLGFYGNATLPGLRWDYGNSGRVRLVANTETVMFTPIYFYGFRFVFFGYADVGWLGESRNPLRNDFYTAAGVGVRFKNERLIFGTIQLRLGLALKNGAMAHYRHLRLSGQQQFDVPEFKAGPPGFFEFE